MLNANPQVITIDAPSLANNKFNDSLNREVLVYLPPSYQHSPDKNYAVVYMIHGFGGNARGWFDDDIPLHKITDQLIESGQIDDMIIVVPENTIKLTCSAYLNSDIQGNWQNFINQDLVKAIESNYRCKSGWENRAIVGHSTGGDAVIKTLLLSSELSSKLSSEQQGETKKIFKHGFAMSAPSLDASNVQRIREIYDIHFEALQQASIGEIAIETLDVWAHVVLMWLQIALPEPDNAPLYCKFPMVDTDWNALEKHMHKGLYQQYKENLRDVNLAFDVGLIEDFAQKTRDLVSQIQADGYAAKLYEFDGGHVDHIGKSLEYVLKYVDDCFKR
jgi:enterochelin esterase-like enzyme